MKLGACLAAVGAGFWVLSPPPLDWAGLLLIFGGAVWFLHNVRPPMTRHPPADYVADPSRFR
jgi:hypothetical protein